MDDTLKIMPGLIEEEAQDAMKYAALAISHKETHPELAAMFMKLSGDELRHMQMISSALSGAVEALHSQYTGE